MITENLSTLKIHKLTRLQYERELEAGNIDENALYLTPDEATLFDYATIEQVNAKADIEHTHSASDIGADEKGAAAAALREAKSYTDEAIQAYIDNAILGGSW